MKYRVSFGGSERGDLTPLELESHSFEVSLITTCASYLSFEKINNNVGSKCIIVSPIFNDSSFILWSGKGRSGLQDYKATQEVDQLAENGL